MPHQHLLDHVTTYRIANYVFMGYELWVDALAWHWLRRSPR